MTSATFFFLFIPILAFVLLAINYVFAPHNPYKEKNGVFECGFTSFLGQNRTQFSISFFIFALLFLLFDLEILLVYPYLVSSYLNESYGLVTLLIFLLALTLGFAFELGKKALSIDSKQTLQEAILNITTITNKAYTPFVNVFTKIYRKLCLKIHYLTVEQYRKFTRLYSTDICFFEILLIDIIFFPHEARQTLSYVVKHRVFIYNNLVRHNLVIKLVISLLVICLVIFCVILLLLVHIYISSLYNGLLLCEPIPGRTLPQAWVTHPAKASLPNWYQPNADQPMSSRTYGDPTKLSNHLNTKDWKPNTEPRDLFGSPEASKKTIEHNRKNWDPRFKYRDPNDLSIYERRTIMKNTIADTNGIKRRFKTFNLPRINQIISKGHFKKNDFEVLNHICRKTYR